MKKFLKDLKKLNYGEGTNKIFTGLSVILLIISVALLGSGGLDQEKSFNTTNLHVVDGDTVKASVNNSNITVRLLGVDTPETYAENSPNEFGLEDTAENRRCLRNWGVKATDYLENFTLREVNIHTDRISENRGDYGRLLAYLEIDGRSVNEALLRKGYARVYESRFSRLESYRDLASEARDRNIGVWSC
ncbi:thermonuclease family protein [Candidatus Nanosalina sp. VS9-1]|uniref:thermonuclease family protein n=1 Tax=Candidatus Nanosalina sp. VS9-1 TaxID=3388566 RepID=UPI0039E06BCD